MKKISIPRIAMKFAIKRNPKFSIDREFMISQLFRLDQYLGISIFLKYEDLILILMGQVKILFFHPKNTGLKK